MKLIELIYKRKKQLRKKQKKWKEKRQEAMQEVEEIEEKGKRKKGKGKQKASAISDVHKADNKIVQINAKLELLECLIEAGRE